MKLDLIKNEIETTKTLDTSISKFKLLKNMIKKDLELVSWQNKAVRVFGEFQIYSDSRSELNSFEHIVSFLTESNFDFADDSLAAMVAYKCPEHFLNFLILKDYKFGKNDIEALSIKYTHYIMEASSLLNVSNEYIQKDLSELNFKYLGGNDPIAMKYSIPQYLN